MSVAEQQAAAPPAIREIANFLRGKSSGVKQRVGVLNGKRVDYFKGSSALKALQSPAYAKLKNAPKVTSEEEAKEVLHRVLRHTFFLRVERGDPVTLTSGPSGGGSSGTKTKARIVQLNPTQMVGAEFYYAWFYEGSQWTTYLGGALMVLVLLVGVMFPLWPPIMRQGVSYLSTGVLGLIGLFFAIAIIRLVFYVITVFVASPGIWIFPQLFADVGFVDSFIPLWDWDIKRKKEKKKKGEKSSKKSKSSGVDSPTGSVSTLEVPKGAVTTDSDNSRPASRNGPTIEEVADEDD